MAKNIEVYDVRIELDSTEYDDDLTQEAEALTLHFQRSIKNFIVDYEDLPIVGQWFTGIGKVRAAEVDVVEIDSIKQAFTFHLIAINPNLKKSDF
jgi:hypothetical protein